MSEKEGLTNNEITSLETKLIGMRLEEAEVDIDRYEHEKISRLEQAIAGKPVFVVRNIDSNGLCFDYWFNRRRVGYVEYTDEGGFAYDNSQGKYLNESPLSLSVAVELLEEQFN